MYRADASETNVEYEYKWRIDAAAAQWSADDVRTGDPLLRRIVDVARSQFHAVATEPLTFSQSVLYLDTVKWCLADNDISLGIVINYGAMAGDKWLVAKETVRWEAGRRDSLEVAQHIGRTRATTALSNVNCGPCDRMRRRTGVAVGDLRPFAQVLQRRRKVRLDLKEGQRIDITLDNTRSAGAHEQIGSGTLSWWFEVESNTGDRRVLAALGELAGTVGATVGEPTAVVTKPMLAAATQGWEGHLDRWKTP